MAFLNTSYKFGNWTINLNNYTHAELDKLKNNIPPIYFRIKLAALQRATREKLSELLDKPTKHLSKAGYLSNFVGLAELFGYQRDEINQLQEMLEKQMVNPTIIILEKQATNQDKMIGHLLLILKLLELNDEHDEILKYIRHDADAWESSNHNNLNFRESSSSDTNNHSDQQIFIDDVLYPAEPGTKPRQYAGFVMHADTESDIEVKELIAARLSQHKMYVVGRENLRPPINFQYAAARAMATRCRRLVVLLSKEFIADANCIGQLLSTFSTDPASWNTKVIPVFLEDVKAPEVIQHLTGVKYYVKSELKEEKFWLPLIAALKAA